MRVIRRYLAFRQSAGGRVLRNGVRHLGKVLWIFASDELLQGWGEFVPLVLIRILENRLRKPPNRDCQNENLNIWQHLLLREQRVLSEDTYFLGSRTKCSRGMVVRICQLTLDNHE